MKETDVCILLGSNIDNREEYLHLATNEIEWLCGNLTAKSNIYETEPWGFESEKDFLNQVIMIQTSLSPLKLLEALLNIEISLGRERKNVEGYISRTIDIDILYFGALVMDTSTLTIPHPRLHLRKFTLIPLAELLPDFIHPVIQKSHTKLLQDVDDFSPVKLFAKTFSI